VLCGAREKVEPSTRGGMIVDRITSLGIVKVFFLELTIAGT